MSRTHYDGTVFHLAVLHFFGLTSGLNSVRLRQRRMSPAPHFSSTSLSSLHIARGHDSAVNFPLMGKTRLPRTRGVS